ncbi:toprim domain-containing protein, partial [Klebsiella pneumoniae]|uniref:toprim domain-containing protein n=1 Tax=Klebsiella pneumoniae TaxID=573 RepID=UPI002730446A
PGTVKKIREILGQGWDVQASVGHVRDLPEREMGVEAPDFKPKYVPTERGKDVLARLRKAVDRANVVYLATDLDREGEA